MAVFTRLSRFQGALWLSGDLDRALLGDDLPVEISKQQRGRWARSQHS